MDIGYWGKQDASIYFCEEKYEYSYWIAEYYNTMSSISYILVGMLFITSKIRNLAISLILVGLGSMFLHGSLRYYGQWCDEGAMLVLSFEGIKYFKPHMNYLYLLLLLFIYILFHNYSLIFLSLFAGLQVYLVVLGYSNISINNERELLVFKGYICLFGLALVFWAIDQFLCVDIGDPVYAHSLWHVFSALGCFFAFIRMAQRDHLLNYYHN